MEALAVSMDVNAVPDPVQAERNRFEGRLIIIFFTFLYPFLSFLYRDVLISIILTNSDNYYFFVIALVEFAAA